MVFKGKPKGQHPFWGGSLFKDTPISAPLLIDVNGFVVGHRPPTRSSIATCLHIKHSAFDHQSWANFPFGTSSQKRRSANQDWTGMPKETGCLGFGALGLAPAQNKKGRAAIGSQDLERFAKTHVILPRESKRSLLYPLFRTIKGPRFPGPVRR